MSASDFTPDHAGLQWALNALQDRRGTSGSVHPSAAAAPRGWPMSGMGGIEALQVLAPSALEAVTRLDDPGFMAHMDPPTPWWTWACAMWAASMNQNLLHPETAPSARVLETAVIDWLAPAFGMDGGQLVPGSTIANLTALWVARDLRGATSVVCSQAAHVSVRKAAHLLGMRLVEVATDAHQRLRADQLPDDLRTSAVVLTAGTTIAGAIDPVPNGLECAWLHLDAAWAGPLRLSSHAHLLDAAPEADSVAVSAHKWLYQPKESAMILFRDTAATMDCLAFGAAYLQAPNVGLLGSHGNTALPLAATLLAWGQEGVRARIDADMALAKRLADLVEADPAFELWGPPVTGIVVWRPKNADPRAVRDRVTDAWVSLAEVDGQAWWRSVAVNPAADPALVLERARQALG